MRVSVFGLGYVGSVTAACLAKAGHQVTGVDSAQEKVAVVAAGASPVIEKGLGELIAAQVRAGKLTATTSCAEAVAASDLALICVGTPGRNSGQPDLGALERVAAQIVEALHGRSGVYTLVVRSTVMPGTIAKVFQPLVASHQNGLRLQVAVNPEFMREGSAIRDFDNPPFVLAGCGDAATGAVLRALYAGVEAPFLMTSIKTAEMVKFVSNAFHALKICFANEVAEICDSLDVDGSEVMGLFALDRKLNISEAYLRPGFAFGGSCLPKDVRALAHAARLADVEAPLLSSIIPSNEARLRQGILQVMAAGKRRIGVIGLAFKPGTDDVRESPLLSLMETLIGKGYDLRVFDGHLALATLVGANRRELHEKIPHIAALLCQSLKTLLAHAEVLVIGHACPEATQALASVKPGQVVVDLTRGVAWSAPESSTGTAAKAH
jgi:GDP-mannose 6-dehydrogenase